MTFEADDDHSRMSREHAEADERRAIRSVARELHVDFPSVPLDHAAILVECLWSHFDGAAIRDFVPVLVMKQAREELLDHLGPGLAAAVTDRISRQAVRGAARDR